MSTVRLIDDASCVRSGAVTLRFCCDRIEVRAILRFSSVFCRRTRLSLLHPRLCNIYAEARTTRCGTPRNKQERKYVVQSTANALAAIDGARHRLSQASNKKIILLSQRGES
jgi:hypothetical protein